MQVIAQTQIRTRAFKLASTFAFIFLSATGCGDLVVNGSISASKSEISLNQQSSGVGALIEVTSSTRQLSNVTAVKVGSTSQVIVSATSQKIVFVLMPGTTSGRVTVTLPEGDFVAAESLVVNSNVSPSPTQTGSKMTAASNVGVPGLGLGIAISADGNTAIVGGFRDNSNTGAAFVFTKSGSAWTQQAKLIASDSVGAAMQGISVAISADGNTAIIGMRNDNSNVGAAAVFVRDSNGSWSQQGAKLVGSDGTGASQAGVQVALSADGNTALVGGWNDNSGVGAAWIYKRSSGVWSQDGSKLTGTGQVGAGNFGGQVALNAAGDRALVSAYGDNSGVGATFVFQRSGSGWSQVGSKLVGTGATGSAYQGSGIAFDALGKTALIGGYNDASGTGAVWIFTEDSGTWTQQGSKLVGSGGSGTSYQGVSGAISSDGNMIAIGGFGDNSNLGAVWIFTRTSGVWSQVDSKINGSGATAAANFGRNLSLSADRKTLIVGAPADDSNTGAFWTFVL